MRTSAVATLMTGLVLLAYSGLSTARLLVDGNSGFGEVLVQFLVVFTALLGVGLLIGGVDQLLLRNDHKLSMVMLGVLLIPLFGGLNSAVDPLTPHGVGSVLLIWAGALCAAATWILHTAHRATAAPPDPPQSEPID